MPYGTLTILCTTPYHTIPYHTIPYHTIPYCTIPYHTIPYQYHTIPYHTRPHHAMPYRTIPRHTIPSYGTHFLLLCCVIFSGAVQFSSTHVLTKFGSREVRAWIFFSRASNNLQLLTSTMCLCSASNVTLFTYLYIVNPTARYIIPGSLQQLVLNVAITISREPYHTS